MAAELSHCDKVGTLGATMGSISLFSTLFVLFLYKTNQSLRNFTFRIVVYLQISDLMLSISIIFMSFENLRTETSEGFCVTQAFLLNYGVLSTTIWTFLITFIMLVSLKYNVQWLKKHEKYYLMIGYGIPLILSIIPLGLGYFGPSGFWCWVMPEYDFFVFFFYGIVIFVIFFNAAGTMFIYRYLMKLQKMNLVKKTSLFYKLRFYPLILTILWIFPTFNRFSYEIGHYTSNWTHFAHIGCESLVGVTNMIYYALTPKVRAILKKKYCFIFHKNKKKDILMVTTDERERGSTQDGNKESIQNDKKESIGDSMDQD